MPEIVLTASMHSIMCPHAGNVSWFPRQVPGPGGELLDTDTYIVSGCPFVLPSGRPSPCVRVQWLRSSEIPDPAAKDRRKVVVPPGYALTPASIGICLGRGGEPQGQAVIVLGEFRETLREKIVRSAQEAVAAAERARDELQRSLDNLGGGL